MVHRVDAKPKTFEGVNAEENSVFRICEHDQGRQRLTLEAHEGNSHIPNHSSAIRSLEVPCQTGAYANALQLVARHPGVCGSGIDEALQIEPPLILKITDLECY